MLRASVYQSNCSTGLGKKASARLCECCSQGQGEATAVTKFTKPGRSLFADPCSTTAQEASLSSLYASACQQQRGSSGYREEEGPLSTNTNPIRYIAAYWGERERGWERAPHHCVERQAGAVAGGGGMDACSFALSMLEKS